MKILFVVYNSIDTCSFYRSAGIAPDLRSKIDIDIEIRTWRDEFHWAKLTEYSLIMMQRPYTETALQMGLYAKNMGVPVWTDFDDLTIDVPYDSELWENYGNQAKNTIRQIIRISDVVSVTTEYLKQQISDLNENIQVIPNAFNDYIFRRRLIPVKRQKILAWRGGTTHTADLLAFRDPIVKSIEKYPDWVFAFMGLRPMHYPEYANIKHYPITDPMVYFRNVSTLAPVAFHIPLKDNPFNRSKSNIAFIEAAVAGCVCIAPGFDEWKNLPGVYNYDNAEEYELLIDSIIDAAVSGSAGLKTYADEAWQYVVDHLRLSDINNLRAEIVKSLL